ncbi:MAG: GNAT family N-acetyltransferase [Clostridia bacterium]|nr:GNAT family N-acetyltransferase [Clostridia bacterium]
MIKLQELNVNDGEDIYSFLQTINNNENEFKNDVFGMSFLDFKKWLINQTDIANGINLPIGYVRQKIYWLLDSNVPVGFGKLRFGLTEQSRIEGGNIGIAISTNFRGKGYGKILVKLLIEEARDNGITELLATVIKTNTPSIKSCLGNGGEIIKETDKWVYISFDKVLNGGK